MNMNKALQHLYKAITGEDNRKVNISKLLVDIHYALTNQYPAVKNNWSRIIDSLAENWPGGGGGGLVHHTYTGNVANIMSQIPYYSTFAEVLFNGGAFARLTATLGTDTATLTVVSNDGQKVQASLQILTTGTEGVMAMATYIAEWDSNGTLNVFEQIANADDSTWESTNFAPMASQVSCTLEVVVVD